MIKAKKLTHKVGQVSEMISQKQRNALYAEAEKKASPKSLEIFRRKAFSVEMKASE